jgi:hypothetical protein
MTGLPRPSGIVSWWRDAHALVLRTEGALIALD